MKVNTDWKWYRFFSYTWDRNPKTLCVLFWKCVWTAVLYLFVAVIIFPVVMLVLTYPLWGWFISSGLFVFTSFMIYSALGAVVLVNYRQYLYAEGKLKRKVKQYREPSMIVQYASAAHRKVCPFIDYTSGE